MTSGKNSWICESEKVLIRSPFMQFIERECRSSEDGRKQKFYLMKSRDWCNIIPVTADGKVVMVKQYRIGISQHTLEIPGGVVDAEDLRPEIAALREMTEETGYAPADGFRCVSLGWSHSNPAIVDNRVHSFIAGPVKKDRAQKLDAGEMIEVIEVPIGEIPSKIASGEITHSLMLNTFFFAALKASPDPAASGALVKALGAFQAIGAQGSSAF